MSGLTKLLSIRKQPVGFVLLSLGFVMRLRMLTRSFTGAKNASQSVKKNTFHMHFRLFFFHMISKPFFSPPLKKGFDIEALLYVLNIRILTLAIEKDMASEASCRHEG